ncbi:EamA family transporter [Acinetobacter apis]|uniref:Threonine/homoserine efflux transporter RhtA n=1 Tax=Acinetobacter apis TaxID=1229165 RepID=A0A217EHF4_9GAMM|nr:DMT family transporter [Acinetobacter apis]SNQ29931.1 Threonine/homoserine efflux transporter RhtA [Acinetobacter apis]
MGLNITLYALIVIIWGTTWRAITLQQYSDIAPLVAVFWRFIIAAVLLLAVLRFMNRLTRLSWVDHAWCGLQGSCVFGFNFICFYTAIDYMNSGLESIIFSMAVLFNTLNSRLFFKQAIPPRFYAAMAFGLAGVVALFWHDVQSTVFQIDTVKGVTLCFLGTYGFSLGNMLSLKHQKKGLDIFTTTAYAMLYGALLMFVINLFVAKPLFPVMHSVSVWAILYLAVLGSVVGFCAYFFLIGRIGAANAAYSTLLFPLVALAISTVFEGYMWSSNAVLGIVLILLGNAIFFIKRIPRAVIKPS